MDSRTRVINVLNHKSVDRFPRALWDLPNVKILKPKEHELMFSTLERDTINPRVGFATSRYQKGLVHRMPRYTDEFGCTFEVAEEGVVGEVKDPIFRDLDDIDRYIMPFEILETIDKDEINRQCADTNKFTLASTHIRPFERLQFMRGTEDLFVDLAMEEEKILKLLKRLHHFYMKELEILTDTDIDGFSFMDDWGSQVSLLINPQMWRELFKPLYKDYCDLARSRGKYIFFHSDGFIEEIYPDLIEIGIDAINSQLFCMDIEKLVDLYGDKVCFWGEIDRQYILPFGSVEDVKKAVDRVADAIIAKNGKRTGAFAQCEWNAVDPVENIKAVFAQWDTK